MIAISQRGEACSCMSYASRETPSPRAAQVPTNALIIVGVPDGWPALRIRDEETSPRGKYHVEMRTPSTSKRPSSTVGAKVEAFVDTAAGSVVQLTPDKPLAPGSLYEVWAIDESPAHASRLLQVVRTGTSEDRDAPAWKGPTTVTYSPPAGPGAFTICGNGPDIDFDGSPATDEGPLRYEVWLSPDVPVDVGKAPTLVTTGLDDKPPGLFSIGQSDCSWPVVIPESAALHVGVRAVDWAGNHSPLFENVLVTTPPKTTTKTKPK
jgi:hypothetical protein